ncbi:MAG TPA: hypothetical protein VLG16_03080 [Candidatus Saccharimonadales bacterium]|nr:hypothetical protein [Candidatus Saccharimonadales bacterium]
MNATLLEQPQVDKAAYTAASFDSIMAFNGFSSEAFEGPQYKVASDIGNIAVSVVMYGSDAKFGVSQFNTAQGTEVARGTVSNIAQKYNDYKAASGQTEAEYHSIMSNGDEDNEE